MALQQYDIILTVNTASIGVEFDEKKINLPDKSLLIGGANGQPASLSFLANKVLRTDGTDIFWGDEEAIEDLTGTSSLTWEVGEGENTNFKLAASAGTVAAAAGDGTEKPAFSGRLTTTTRMGENGVHLITSGISADWMHADAANFGLASVATAPSSSLHIANKQYVDDAIEDSIAANDAMRFGGVAATQTAFESLVGVNYLVGLTIKASATGVFLGGEVLESGDMLICVADAGGTYSHSDWTVIQANVDGAVTSDDSGDSVQAGHIPQFTTTSNGKIIGNSGKKFSDYTLATVTQALREDHDTLALNVSGHIGSGGAAHAAATTSAAGFMTAAQVLKLNGIEEGANDYTHPTQAAITSTQSGTEYIDSVKVNALGHVTAIHKSSRLPANFAMWTATKPTSDYADGAKGQMHIDTGGNYLYICVADDTWRRFTLAKGWVD